MCDFFLSCIAKDYFNILVDRATWFDKCGLTDGMLGGGVEGSVNLMGGGV